MRPTCTRISGQSTSQFTQQLFVPEHGWRPVSRQFERLRGALTAVGEHGHVKAASSCSREVLMQGLDTPLEGVSLSACSKEDLNPTKSHLTRPHNIKQVCTRSVPPPH